MTIFIKCIEERTFYPLFKLLIGYITYLRIECVVLLYYPYKKVILLINIKDGVIRNLVIASSEY